MTRSVLPEELAAILGQVQLIDVRRRPAFEASPGMVSGAVWRNPDDVARWMATIERNRPVVVYCVHGHEVSQGCADFLENSGLDAFYLVGGFDTWAQEKRPVVMK